VRHSADLTARADFVIRIVQAEAWCSVVVGTPGRVMESMRQGTLEPLDFAAWCSTKPMRMLRMGLHRSGRNGCLKQLPEQRQVVLLSATHASESQASPAKYLKDPAESPSAKKGPNRAPFVSAI